MKDAFLMIGGFQMGACASSADIYEFKNFPGKN
jgi:hypothetical protein